MALRCPDLPQEANVLENLTWEAQLGETIRLLASLPEALKVNNFQVLYDDMIADYRARAPYARYLIKLRQDLLIAYDQLLHQKERIQRINALYFMYHKTVQINSFVEKRENEIIAYGGMRTTYRLGIAAPVDSRGAASALWQGVAGRRAGSSNTSTPSSYWTRRRPW